MKTLKSVLNISLLIVVSVLRHSETFAQKNALPPELSQNSTVQEILEYLNKTGFPDARIGLDVPVTQTVKSLHYSDPVVFSRGFKLVSPTNDCHILLKNEDVTVYDVGSLRRIDLRELTESQSPYAAEFSTWLETVSHDGGKAPFLHTSNPEGARLFGAWQAQFKSRGFFTRSIFGVRIPALRRGIVGNQFETDSTVAFMFGDRHDAERFDAAFRRVIKLCQSRGTKPRGNR